MYIRKLEIENWKCFSDYLSLTFSNIEIFSFPNGSGKTSILEAIIYAMYGKTDNKLSSYQNHEGQTIVSLEFENDGSNYLIKREFPKTVAKLYKDDEEIKDGIRELFDYMNSMLNYEITKRLWFKGEVGDSEVLNFNFFKNNILEEKLKEPTYLYKHYVQERTSKKKQLKGLSVEETRRLKDIEADINEISSKIKDRSNINDRQYAKALQVSEANDEMEDLMKEFASKADIVDRSDIMRWNSIDEGDEQERLESEQQKIVDKTLSAVGNSILKKVSHINDEQGHCVICNGEWKDDRSDYINKILREGFQDNNVIRECRENLEFKKQYTDDQIKNSKHYYELKTIIDSMPNFQEVIDSFNKENDALWDKLDLLNKEKEKALYNKSIQDMIAELESDIKEVQGKIEFLRDYLDKATEEYTKTLLDKSSEILMAINPSYSGISISAEDSSLEVLAKDNNLLVSQLSRGEKTMVAVSLIYTIRDIFTPGMPLIFDESFSGLSHDNNYRVIDFIKDSHEQLFIVSHNPDWIEYDNYPDSVNIRTSWDSVI